MTSMIAFVLATGAFYLHAPIYGVVFLAAGMLASIDA